MDKESPKNFSLESNLSFVHKIIEKAVASCLHDHLSQNMLYKPFQSAYRKYQGTDWNHITLSVEWHS